MVSQIMLFFILILDFHLVKKHHTFTSVEISYMLFCLGKVSNHTEYQRPPLIISQNTPNVNIQKTICNVIILWRGLFKWSLIQDYFCTTGHNVSVSVSFPTYNIFPIYSCENKSALLIFLILNLKKKKSQKSNL